MRLPISALKDLANRFGFSHVIVYVYDSEKNMQHIATWGRSVQECDQAAQFGNMMKDALRWPDSLHADPNRVKRLKQRIKDLEQKLAYVDRQHFAQAEWRCFHCLTINMLDVPMCQACGRSRKALDSANE